MKPVTTPIPFDLESGETGCFQTDNSQVALEWCAVLASQKIDFELSREGDLWLFCIPEPDFKNAEKNISEYEQERQSFNKNLEEFNTPSTPLELGKSLPFIFCSIFLLLFHMITGPVKPKAPYFNEGTLNSAALFKQGEWWRLITALSLHADFPHVMSNCLFLIIFATIASFQVGPGVALISILISGIAGNLSTVGILGFKSYSSLGASTAVFGALGIITALGWLEYSKKATRLTKLKKWAPLVAGLALLSFTGTAPGTDLIAHLFGFIWGLVIGLFINKIKSYKNQFIMQGILYVISFLIVFFAWSRALS